MRIKVIACKVMLRQLYRIAAQSPHTVDILWMEQELHTRPDDMRAWLQRTIDRVEREESPHDAIALAYGLCSNGTVGLCTRETKLVLPRGHDCITLLLGSRARYAQLFAESDGGAYWYSQGWLESAQLPGKGSGERLYAQYVEKYGADNARYLMEMEQSWMKNYKKAIYIRWPDEDGALAQGVRADADYLGWDYQCVQGDTGLLTDLLGGKWDDERFLVLAPGQAVAASFDAAILKAEHRHA